MTPSDKPDSGSTNKTPEPQPGAAPAANQTEQPTTHQKRKHRRRLIIFSVLFLVILMIVIVYFFRLDIPYRWTDDAYVHGNEVFLVPRVTSTVVSINADDTDLVRKGDPVVLLDDSDAKVALLQAEGALGDTVRKVCQFYVNVAELKASVDARTIDFAKAEEDYERRTNSQPGTVSREDVIHARQARDAARDVLNVTKQQLASAQALVANTDLEHHPLVLQAIANVLDASLALQRTTILAPATGYVVQRNVEVGQRVVPGTPLLAIIPLDQIWVDANFKEAELRFVRIGQPVTLRSDFYGDSVEYHGHVQGLAPTTGAAFSLLPPDEGSGNWIKIIQRVPVRIILDEGPLEKYPLRLGLSMRVTVHTENHGGEVLTQVPSTQPVYETEIYSNEWVRANELVRGLMATNLAALSDIARESAAMPAEESSNMK